MVARLDPFAGTGKARFRGMVLLRGLVTFHVHLDNDVRHCLGVAANQRDFFVGQCLGFFAKQLTAARERNRLGARIRTINELHGAPLERES